MTVWFELDGIDLAVTGEHVKGYTATLDQFRINRVCVRGPSQNIKAALKDSFLKRVVARAVMTARHPVPFPYDVKGN